MKPIIKKWIIPSALFILLMVVALGCTAKQNGNVKTDTAKSSTYFCPMHPQVISDKQGVCPICHMDLVLQTADNAITDGVVSLGNNAEMLAGVTTAPVSEQVLQKQIQAYTVLEIPEQNKKVIAAKFPGRIEQLFAAQSGVYVKKGDPLFVAYSAEVFRAASDYLIAKNNAEQTMQSEAKQIAMRAKKRLQLFGVPEAYIKSVEQNNLADYTFSYTSPYSGYILQKNIVDGAYFSEGNALYEIAELSTLWSIAKVNEQDIGVLKNNMPVALTFPSFPSEEFVGQIQLISPVLESSSRTVSVRVAVNNQSGKLKPNMFGDAKISLQLGRGILIPAEAIVFTGKRNIMWIKTGDGMYEVRDVRVGARYGDAYQVVAGVAVGEEYVVHGNYLIDSESRLKSGNLTDKEIAGTMTDNITATEAPKYIDKNDAVYKKNGVFNRFCPVLGDEVDVEAPMLLYKGKVIGFCCKGCDRKFIKETEKYFGYISKDGKSYTGPTE